MADVCGYPVMKNLNESYTTKTARNIFKFAIEFIILCIWWILVCVVLLSLFIKNLFCYLPIINDICLVTYICVIKSVSALLDIIQNAYPEHSRRTVINDRCTGTPYLERHYLFLRDRQTFPFNVFLHKFITGDPDDIHDHPWGFFHIILSGGYWEYITINADSETLDQGIKKVWRQPGYFNIVGPEYKHKIVLGNERPWTLFIPFKKINMWGFWVPMIWREGAGSQEGSIKNDDNLTSNKWKKINYNVYLEGMGKAK